MSNNDNKGSNGGRPVKLQELANKVRRARVKAVEKEIAMLEALIDEVQTDWATFKNVARGDETATAQQMKALQHRLEMFYKFIEKSDIEDALDYLDNDGQIKKPDAKGSGTVTKPKVVFSTKAKG